MLTNDAKFASFSKTVCWVVSFIMLLLAVLTFTGDSEAAMVNGFLWLAGAFAFAISAIFLGNNAKTGNMDQGGAADSDNSDPSL